MYDNQAGLFAALSTIPLLLVVGIYLYFAYCMMKMARKVNLWESSWWAWIPVLNLFLLFKIAGKQWWWFFLCLVPIVNLVVFLVLWYQAAKACHVSPVWGILMFVPVVNIVAAGVMAFSNPPTRPTPPQYEPQPRQPANVG